MKKRCVLLAAVLLFGVLGCSAQTKTEQVTITFMHGWGGSGTDHEAMRQIYADFEAQNPDIKIIYDTSPDLSVVIDKANEMLAADKMPNIISTNGNAQFVSNAKRKDLALDLSAYIEADPVFSQNIGQRNLQALMETDGSIYTLPDATEYSGYWYNEDLFRQAGLSETPPRTWEEFWAACDALDAFLTVQDQAVMYMDQGQMELLLGARLAALDGDTRSFMQTKQGGLTRGDVEAAVADLQKAVDYSSGNISALDARQYFFEGKSAIYINGVWANTEMTQTSGAQNISYAAFPSSTGQSVAYCNPVPGYVIGNTGSAEQIEACVRLLKYMLSEEVQKRLVTETKQAPSNPNITLDWIHSQVPVLADAVTVCAGADVPILTLNAVLPAKDGAVLAECLEAMLLGKDRMKELISILAENPHDGK